MLQLYYFLILLQLLMYTSDDNFIQILIFYDHRIWKNIIELLAILCYNTYIDIPYLEVGTVLS